MTVQTEKNYGTSFFGICFPNIWWIIVYLTFHQTDLLALDTILYSNYIFEGHLCRWYCLNLQNKCFHIPLSKYCAEIFSADFLYNSFSHVKINNIYLSDENIYSRFHVLFCVVMSRMTILKMIIASRRDHMTHVLSVLQ